MNYSEYICSIHWIHPIRYIYLYYFKIWFLFECISHLKYITREFKKRTYFDEYTMLTTISILIVYISVVIITLLSNYVIIFLTSPRLALKLRNSIRLFWFILIDLWVGIVCVLWEWVNCINFSQWIIHVCCNCVICIWCFFVTLDDVNMLMKWVYLSVIDIYLY